MNQNVIHEVLKKLKANPKLMLKVKIFAAFALVALLVGGTLTIWAGVAAFNYVTSKTSQVAGSPTTQAQVENLKSQAESLKKFQLSSCWNKAQSLMAVEPWLAGPTLDNLKSLMVACLEATPPATDQKVSPTINGGTPPRKEQLTIGL